MRACRCGSLTNENHLVCLTCWHRLPSELRDAWNRATTIEEKRSAALDIIRFTRDRLRIARLKEAKR